MPIHHLRARGRRELFAFAMLALLCASGFAAAGDEEENKQTSPQQSDSALHRKARPMKIQMTVDGAVIATATLDYNDSAKDLAALLPLDLPLKDYATTEKIADLPRKLSIKDAPEAYTPSAGDISFYAPWGNLAIFYKDGHFSSGLVRLGRIDSGLEALKQLSHVSVRMERASQ